MELDKIILGDSAVVLQSFDSDCIDLTVTSPPYDNLRNYNGFVFDFETIAKQLFRVTKSGGVVVWVVGDSTVNGSESGTSFKQALFFKECGFNLHDTMIYKTNKPPLTHNRYEQEFEYMFVFSKGTPKTFNPIMVKSNWAGTGTQGTFRQDATGRQERAHNQKLISDKRIKGNIWHIPSGNGKGTKDSFIFEHPATFPESLASDHILSWSNEGDVILDCFCGSGTTPKMAKVLSRRYIGIETSDKYVALAEKRLLGTGVPLFGLERGITQRAADGGNVAAQNELFG